MQQPYSSIPHSNSSATSKRSANHWWMLAGISIIFLTASCKQNPETITNQQQETAPELIYSNSFDSADDLKDWKMEGPGIAEIQDGKLLIHSKWMNALTDLQKEIPINLNIPGGQSYYQYLEKWVTEKEPQNLAKYKFKRTDQPTAKFVGGHIQYWNTRVHPENFKITIQFQALNPYPLHMVSFCGNGTNGEDLFSPKLKSRYGLASQYMRGDISNYRISYWSGTRKTCNSRKAPGRILLADDTNELPKSALNKPVLLEIIRWKGRVQFKCDNAILTDWTDTENPLKSGYFSLRLMATASGLYDDFNIYKLTENPFTKI